MDALKIEIARVLVCDTSELVLEASGVDLNTIGLHQQDALREVTTISCMLRGMACGQTNEECDLMDDVQWN